MTMCASPNHTPTHTGTRTQDTDTHTNLHPHIQTGPPPHTPAAKYIFGLFFALHHIQKRLIFFSLLSPALVDKSPQQKLLGTGSGVG